MRDTSGPLHPGMSSHENCKVHHRGGPGGAPVESSHRGTTRRPTWEEGRRSVLLSATCGRRRQKGDGDLCGPLQHRGRPLLVPLGGVLSGLSNDLPSRDPMGRGVVGRDL